MKFPTKAVKLAGILAVALGAAVPTALIATPAAAYDSDHGRDVHRDRGFHHDYRDRHEHRGEFRHHRFEHRDGYWYGR